MSEAIKIKEGGVDRSQNQIYKLKTNTVGGGVCYWVPETERQTDDKRITANGTYTAEDEGLYGYDEIDVSVPNTGKMSGTGADGNDYSITVDDNGYIVETKIPSYIQIETLPSTLQYTEGGTIDYSGIVVGAYDADGNKMQTIPFEELIFPTTTAHGESGGGKTSDLISETLVVGDDEAVRHWPDATYKTVYTAPGTKTTVYVTQTQTYVVLAAENDGVVMTSKDVVIKDGTERNIHKKTLNSQYGHNGKTVFYAYTLTSGTLLDLEMTHPFSGTLSDASQLEEKVAWTMVYGTDDTSLTQRLPVQWARTDDLKILDDYFEISVQPA